MTTLGFLSIIPHKPYHNPYVTCFYLRGIVLICLFVFWYNPLFNTNIVPCKFPLIQEMTFYSLTFLCVFTPYLLVPFYLVTYSHIDGNTIYTLLYLDFSKGVFPHFPPLELHESQSYRMLNSSWLR
jgi:hypothetical protein